MTVTHPLKQAKGFTIVELLIIIIVIAILVTITIVSYTAVTDNARKQTAKTDAQTIATQLNKYKSEKGGFPASLNSLTNLPATQSTYQYAYNATTKTYCLTASVKGASAYVTSGNSEAKEGGCAGHGVNGEAPITNLAYNPRATNYTTPTTQAGWRNDRYGSDGTYTLVTGATDGPASGVSTYARMTFTSAVGPGRGFHIVGNPDLASPGAAGMTVEGNKQYTLSAYLRSKRSAGSVSFTMTIRFVDAASSWIGSSTSGSAVSAPIGSPASNPGAWVRTTVTATAPSNAVRAHIYIRETAAPTHVSGDWIDGTGLMITEGSQTYNFADGASTNWVWNGAANASTSTGPAL